MIEFQNVRKQFGAVKAVDGVTARIEEGHVFGLIGTNGAGKSTLLRLLGGVIRPDGGRILVDGEAVYDNPEAKGKIFYISDEQYFIKSGTPRDMLRLYRAYYPGFDTEKWNDLTAKFGLDTARKINTFSKGMKKQLSVICGICANTKYLLCDETFDGLDPVMRQAVKTLFVREMEERGLTPVIASHNLRELEDICEYVGLLHKGGILFERDLDEMKLNIHKIQCIVKTQAMLGQIREGMEVLTMENRGSLYTLTVRGARAEIEAFMEGLDPVFFELLPLSLEEIFISETEVQGYDVKALIL
ncbi:MAG: ABC transporter ATP-binding protein [Lachnospiraceae bacterium]|jgi:ABC-2 type transport system ATP-binding protein|nr:ABC transporter ATP-binding protein [Lachnospiraceae bacterium]